jgi:hypothetical protein
MKYLLCLIAISFVKISIAQNLVPNPSFEDTIHCQTLLLEDLAGIIPNWRSCRQTADYFNTCHDVSTVHSVPANTSGYQQPATGNGYVGFFTNGIGQEIFGETLNAPLEIGESYYVSFKVSLANQSGIASDNLGVRFSNVVYRDSLNAGPLPAPLTNTVDVSSSLIVTDTLNWTIISGVFVADSAYSEIMVGAFRTASNQTTVGFNPFGYYYVDDVCVSTDSLECDLNTSTNHQTVQSKLSIYPIITHQAVNITFQQGLQQFNIFNAFGQSVYNSNITSLQQTIDVSQFPDGIYFVRAQTHQSLHRTGFGGVQTAKFVVQR